MTSYAFRIGLLGLACMALASTAAVAQSSFDGSWSVLIITRRGACDPSYRSGVRIVNGYITPEAIGFNLNGRVSRNGTLRVVISAGDQSGSGSGRLTRTRGSGVWQGRGSRGFCAGTWVAERQ